MYGLVKKGRVRDRCFARRALGLVLSCYYLNSVVVSLFLIAGDRWRLEMQVNSRSGQSLLNVVLYAEITSTTGYPLGAGEITVCRNHVRCDCR
ncbi:hypothetical protein B0T19DRAFT_280547 [Cercophora scortea]|uniref:Uncharacterized protein n=1 Tax=Cercophora scortea TaxID=314031 RepID=A0AAE0M5E6_9PEZI|nr:hypothetical protein B0T19DRAFT_280547 [Cercophora scortea]